MVHSAPSRCQPNAASTAEPYSVWLPAFQRKRGARHDLDHVDGGQKSINGITSIFKVHQPSCSVRLHRHHSSPDETGWRPINPPQRRNGARYALAQVSSVG